MNKFLVQALQLPYSQPFANFCLNSSVPISLSEIKPSIKKINHQTLPTKRNYPIPYGIWWLFAGSEPEKILAICNTYHWLVDISTGQVLLHEMIGPETFAAFLVDQRYIYNVGPLFVLQKTVPSDPIPVERSLMDEGRTPLAFLPIGDELIYAIQTYATPVDSHSKALFISRSPYAGRYNEEKWLIVFPEFGSRSPTFLDGTLVIFLPDSLRLVGMDGKEICKIEETFIAGMVSTDKENVIWGLKKVSKGISLLGYTRQGVKVAEVVISTKDPVQPPVVLNDGRVLMVTRDRVVCVTRTGKILWTKKIDGVGPAPERNIHFDGGQDPLVTASADGKILIKHGSSLTLLADSPHPIWSIKAPENKQITSNAVITADGRVCFACTQDIYCLEK